MTNDPYSRQRVHNSDGGTVYANQGGDQTIYMESVKDHLQNGLMALKGRMYAKAVAEFEEFLSDTRKIGAQKMPEARRDLATGHFCAALAMLDGRPPNDRSPEQIDRVEAHVEQAIGYGDVVVTHQANVLWALVKDDYYTAIGMRPKPPAAGDLAASIGQLQPAQLEPLVTHVRRAQGRTFKLLQARAGELGMVAAAEPEQAPVVREFDPARGDAVRRYFVRTPRHRSPAPGAIALAVTALCVAFAAWAHDVGSLLPLAIAYFAGKWGWQKVRQYRTYLERYAAAEPKPSDAQMDSWLQQDIAALQLKASRQVRLVATTKHEGGDLVYPIQAVVGVPSPAGAIVDSLRVRRGDDHRWRANHYDVLIMFLTNDLISLYRCALDFHTGEPVYEQLTEWHYRDIVGVSTDRIPMPASITALFRKVDELFEHDVDGENEKYADIPYAQEFTISIVNGQRVNLNTGFGETLGADNEIAWLDNERALTIIKKMVRARHTSA
ncbi:hypothetical protein [Amycolatopsis sp.]|uniref:hypothetical protein n=1 Tax=Amycolatopsis sp. TaxID=37632 RepID=UPI002D7F58D9|nr:hypothetical protein [Amycolatopsis sp.]HET6706703.1 hypothetical protein [Amycolatopsis sp.]